MKPLSDDARERLANAQGALLRAGEVGEPYIVLTQTHLIASGNRDWFLAMLEQAQRQLNDLKASPPKPALDPHLH